MSSSLVSNAGGNGVRIDVTPESANWRFLSFANVQLPAGGTHTTQRAGQEIAIVPLAGAGIVNVGEQQFTLSRVSVFEEMPSIVYAHRAIRSKSSEATMALSLRLAPHQPRVFTQRASLRPTR